MRFVLMVTGPPYGTQQSSTAYQLSKAIIITGHELVGIFFYKEGVYNANSLISPAGDEIDLVRAWEDFHRQYNVPLYVCIAAALRRGVINSIKNSNANENKINVQDGFLISGLGVIMETILTCDRLIQL